jgi:rubrerythrin
MNAPKRKFNRKKYNKTINHLEQLPRPEPKPDPIDGDLSFTAHDDATHWGCKMCGNDWKSLNSAGYCSSCWTIWNS